MPAPLLLDLSHTSHTRARTGVQRVARSLFTALGSDALPITHDPYRRTWRTLEPWENANLAATAPSKKRGAHWPLRARLRGFLLRSQISNFKFAPDAHGLLVPEIFSAAVAAALPPLFAAVPGPRVAVFHDAIALKFPELTPTKTVARFPAYLAELLAFDGIAAVSEDSRDSLVDYWRWLGASNTPPVRAIPLGIDTHAAPRTGEFHPTTNATAAPSDLTSNPAILCVGSIEGRKNHLALLDACESLWSRGARFSLRLIGLAQPQTAAPALARIAQLQAAGRPLRYDGPASESALHAAYAAAAFTVYPSLLEGFGLPVLESVAHGRSCICSARGALGESARGGGCLALDRVDAPSLAAAISRLLDSPAELAALTRAARARRLRTWADYARDIRDILDEFPRRASA